MTRFATEASDTLMGFGTTEELLMLGGADVFQGSSSADVVNGNMGNDTLYGNAGNDYLLGGKGEDSISGDNGNDDLNGNVGNDTVVDFSGANTLHGGQGDDTISGAGQLFGDLGNDRLEGNTYSSETFTGGQGADTFVIPFPAYLATVDRIKDFNFAEGDRLDITEGRTIHVGIMNTPSGAYISYDSPVTLFSYYVILEGIDAHSINQNWFI